jgi:hypothetical protein
MTQADRIIQKFGTVTRLARALGHPHATTVQAWKKRGFIPQRQHEAVYEAAKRECIPLEPSDFSVIKEDAA